MTWLQHQFLQLVGFVWVRRRIVRAFYTDWDNRFGFYLDDGWVYVYRSFILLARFNLKSYMMEHVGLFTIKSQMSLSNMI